MTPRDKNENPVKIDFVSLDQTSESLIPDRSLSGCLKHGTIGERFPDNNQSNSRCTLKLKG